MRHAVARASAALAVPLIWLIRLYQLAISPMLAQQCRFYPSCSAYAVTALGRHGVARGSWLAARRLARCHPWNPGGVDHVPPSRADRGAAERAEHAASHAGMHDHLTDRPPADSRS